MLGTLLVFTNSELIISVDSFAEKKLQFRHFK